MIGLKVGTKLRLDAESHPVTPLPEPGEFDPYGHTQLPGGVARTTRAIDATAPPRQRRVAIVPPGVSFRYDGAAYHRSPKPAM